MQYDVVIIGAGPAGLTTSFFLRDLEVLIIEEHFSPGTPKHCTGLVGEYTAEFYKSILGQEIIDNEYSRIIFHTPRGKHILDFKQPVAYHVSRPLLEEKLLEKNISLGHGYLNRIRAKPGPRPGEILVRDKTIRPKNIVAADGPLSIFARRYMGRRPSFIVGVQKIHRATGIDTDEFHVFYNNHTQWFFQWMVPLDTDRILIGYAERPGRIPSHDIVIRLIESRTSVSLGEAIETFGGVIPIDKPPRSPIYNNMIYFIGDSLPATKPYTGGGLYGIARLSKPLAQAIIENNPSIYREEYSRFRKRLVAEHLATSISRLIGYWIPARITGLMFERGLIDSSVYDNHSKIILKAFKRIDILIEALVR